MLKISGGFSKLTLADLQHGKLPHSRFNADLRNQVILNLRCTIPKLDSLSTKVMFYPKTRISCATHKSAKFRKAASVWQVGVILNRAVIFST